MTSITNTIIISINPPSTPFRVVCKYLPISPDDVINEAGFSNCSLLCQKARRMDIHSARRNIPKACLLLTDFLFFKRRNMDRYIKSIPQGIAPYPNIRASCLNMDAVSVTNGESVTDRPVTNSIIPKNIWVSLLLIVSFSFFFLGMCENII